MRFRIETFFMMIISFVFSCTTTFIAHKEKPLSGKVLCLDPGHGGTAEYDAFRVGPTGEREEWIDLRVALFLRDMLESRGATVLMAREKDVAVSLKSRAMLAVENHADAFISIHHNATADRNVNFPIIYFHGNASENQASVLLGKAVAKRLSEALFESQIPVSLVSDHTIFPNSGTAVLRHSYGIPGVIGEASFFTNPAEEEKLKQKQYNRKEAKAYLKALQDFFSKLTPPIKEKYSKYKIEPFSVLQEAERMNEIAKKWKEDFYGAKRCFQSDNPDSLEKAYQLFTRSARSFPDSYLARECHVYRAKILKAMGESEKAAEAQKRVDQYYIDLDGERKK